MLLHHPRWGQGRDCLHQQAQVLQGCWHRTRQSATPRPTAWGRYGGQASHHLLWRSFHTQAGLIFRPPGLYTFTSGTAEQTPGNRFSPTSTAAVSASTSGDRQWGSTSPPPSPALGGSPVESWLCPWTETGSSGHHTAARRVQRSHCTVNSLACIYSAMYSVISQYCSNCCPFSSSTALWIINIHVQHGNYVVDSRSRTRWPPT